ncbi:MAG: glycosyltransferase family 2 protein [Spirochaetes bacterium]|nr:glycosyltransferase family 2 protein [Spirochaetota bacterium]
MINSYVLISAVCNEEKYIESTIKSVLKQTFLPKKWIFCINNSTDNTENIIKKYQKEFDFIKVLSFIFDRKRSFCNKSKAIYESYLLLKKFEHSGLIFDFIGILDTDITFNESFYEMLINKMNKDQKIGIAAGQHIEKDYKGKFKLIKQHLNMAEGGAQFFRKECFYEIDSYRPLVYGGEDTLAGIMARMSGWKTVTFTDINYYHHRIMGTQDISSVYKVYTKIGIKDNFLGMHPLYAFLKFIKNLKKIPYVIGALSWFFGYISGFLRKKDTFISKSARKFFCKEQLQRISFLRFFRR